VLSTLEVYSSWPSVPLLPLSEGGTQTDPIQIRKITGLEPVKANINTSPYGSMDGESFNGASVPKRNIVITVGLNPDWNVWTPEALRRLLYSYFMPKQQVRLVFRSDDDFPPVEIFGYTENVEPNIFSKDSEIQISVICPDPYFTSVEPIEVVGISQRAAFAVPQTVNYKGSIETGFNVKITQADGDTPYYVAVQSGDPSYGHFWVIGQVTETKYMLINSVTGDKYVRHIEQGTGLITNLLSNIDPGYTWPTLRPGPNPFLVHSNAGVQDWTLTYFEKYGGL
jgi:hypothetical protein